MAVQSVITTVPLSPERGVSLGGSAGAEKAKGFGDFLEKNMKSVNDDLVNATKMSKEFMVEGKHELHEVIIALEKADLSFRYLTQIRNKVLDAYTDIMRTQV